jgi:hypothetical protein
MGSQNPHLECRLESAHDLAALLAVLQLKEKDQKDQRVYCEATRRGLKFTAQSAAKDVAVLAWMFSDAFREYSFSGEQEMHLKIPVAPLLACLQIFSDKAALVLKYPSGPSDELRFVLEEDGATTECCLRTLVLDEAPAPMSSFFAPGDPLCMFRLAQPEAWHHALAEFGEIDMPDATLQIALHSGQGQAPRSVVLRAQTLMSDAEVEIPKESVDELHVPPEFAASGDIVHRYHVGSVLSSCLRAAKDAKAVKVRFNRNGAMSNQFILRGRGQRDLFCEALVSPLAEFNQGMGGNAGGLDIEAEVTQGKGLGASVFGNPYTSISVQ